jgi:hypothetical protein
LISLLITYDIILVMFNSSITEFRNYFERLEREMQVRNPSKVGLIRQIKNISLKNAQGKVSDDRTRKALEDLLVRYNINPSAVRRNELYALSVGLAKQPFDYNDNGLTDLVEQGSKPGVNLLAGVRTNRTKGILSDFKTGSPQQGIVSELGKKGKVVERQGIVQELGNKNRVQGNSGVLFDLNKKVGSGSQGLGLGKYINSPKGGSVFELQGKHKVSGLKLDFNNSHRESIVGEIKGLSDRERQKNVRQKGIIGALAGAGKK